MSSVLLAEDEFLIRAVVVDALGAIGLNCIEAATGQAALDVVTGKAALRAYFRRALDVYPNLSFELIDLMWGLESVVLYYVNQKRSKTGEYMEIGPTGKISKVVANYSG